jgi:hypothetical protein
MDERVLVITPSRGRPVRLGYMLEETLRTSGDGTHVAVCYDDDDPSAAAYDAIRDEARDTWPGRTFWHRGRRRTLPDWTNFITAWPRAHRYPYLASLGDDHAPRTDGWDTQLTAAIEARGGTGIAYGDDGHQHENLPTAPVISADIIRVLGWMMLPGLVHMFADNAWRDLGSLAGCLAYVPGVVIEHLHPDAGKAAFDATYAQGASSWAVDEAVYLKWVNGLRDLDVRAVTDAMKLRELGSPADAGLTEGGPLWLRRS